MSLLTVLSQINDLAEIVAAHSKTWVYPSEIIFATMTAAFYLFVKLYSSCEVSKYLRFLLYTVGLATSYFILGAIFKTGSANGIFMSLVIVVGIMVYSKLVISSYGVLVKDFHIGDNETDPLTIIAAFEKQRKKVEAKILAISMVVVWSLGFTYNYFFM